MVKRPGCSRCDDDTQKCQRPTRRLTIPPFTMAPRLRSNGKRGSASGGHSWFGAIMLSAAIIVSAILFWNATSLQSSMQSSTALQDILLSTPCSNRGDTSLAFQQSMGFFDDIAEKEWTEIHQPRARNTVHYKNTANPDMESTHT